MVDRYAYGYIATVFDSIINGRDSSLVFAEHHLIIKYNHGLIQGVDGVASPHPPPDLKLL